MKDNSGFVVYGTSRKIKAFEEKLKDCPFCGRRPKLQNFEDDGSGVKYVVFCGCGMSFKAYCDEFFEKFNERI